MRDYSSARLAFWYIQGMDVRQPIALTCATCALAGLLAVGEPTTVDEKAAWLPQASYLHHSAHLSEAHYSAIVRVSNVSGATSATNHYEMNAEPGTYVLSGFAAGLISPTDEHAEHVPNPEFPPYVPGPDAAGQYPSWTQVIKPDGIPSAEVFGTPTVVASIRSS